ADIQHVVVGDVGRGGSAAVAAHVGRDRAVAGAGDDRHLLAPRAPQLGKAVHEHDGLALADLGDVHVDAVGRYGSMRELVHARDDNTRAVGDCGRLRTPTFAPDVDSYPRAEVPHRGHKLVP